MRITAGGHSLAADFNKEGEIFKLAVLSESISARPGAEKGFREVLAGPEDSNRDINMSFYADHDSERRARASWLRSAYLVMFAVLGYRYVFQPSLARVRRRIADPETEHVPTFLCILPGDHPWSERRIIKMLEPEWQQCWAVQMGRSAPFSSSDWSEEIRQVRDAAPDFNLPFSSNCLNAEQLRRFRISPRRVVCTN